MQRIVTAALPFTELPVATGNFDNSRATIDRVIIHTMDGTWQGAAARFNNPSQKVSAHYGIKLDGGLIHWLEENKTGYHSGDYSMNQRSIGIEHEDGGDYNGVRPDALYTTSATLVRDICTFYNIPIDRDHIRKHSEVSDKPTACPDALDIDRIVAQAKGGSVPSNQGLPANYPDIVHGSSQWDASVQAFLPAGTLPKDASFADVQKVVAAYKGQATQANSQVGDLKQQLAAAQTEVSNRVEQVGRLQAQLSDLDSSWNARYIALKNTIGSVDAVVAHYEGIVGGLQNELDTALKDKGKALVELSTTKTALEQCQTGQQVPIDLTKFSVAQLIGAVFTKITQRRTA